MEVRTNGFEISQTDNGEVEISQSTDEYGNTQSVTLTLSELPLFIESIKGFQSSETVKEAK